ncbi:MAG: LysR family transcriptional regulator [Chloroflexi bacterium]|nr:LysR family transcriptional regulator [Chloroflexota bacterium]
MDLMLLRSFLAVAERGSFTAAARELGLTQPGVSRQMRKLERAFGATLLQRAGGGVRLTAPGERVRAYAAAVVEGERELRLALRDSADAVAGVLRIAASTTPGEFLVPGYVARFVERHSEVRPQIAIADSTAVVEDLVARRADVGFVGARLPRPGLRFVTIAEDEVVLAVPATHPFAARAAVDLADLAGQAFVEREGGSGTSLSVSRVLAERRVSLPPHRVVMVVNTTQAMVSAIQRGYGIGFVSSLALADRTPGRVAALRLADLRLRRALYLVYEARRALSLPASAFVAFVRRAGSGASGDVGAPNGERKP